MPSILIQLTQGLRESYHICIAVEIVTDCWGAFHLQMVTVGIDNIHYSLDHLFLPDPAPDEYTLGVVSVHPDFDSAKIVDSEVLLLHLETSILLGYLVETD